MENNCAFQFAKTSGGIFGNTKIVYDKSELTLEQAKEAWNRFYPDAAKFIKEDGTIEMALWINMKDPADYRESLWYISSDAESDGKNIFITKRDYFPAKL